MSSVFKLELFTVLSLLLVSFALFLTHRFVKPERRKYCYLIASLGCIVIHFSDYVIDLINGTAGEVPSNLFLPEWPCNVIMWMSLAISIMLFFKDNYVRKYLLYISFWVGTVCTVIGIAGNFSFLDNPSFSDWSIMKGLLSHVFLVYCCLYPASEKMVGYNFIRITFSMLITDLLFIGCGIFSQKMHLLLGRDPGGTMLDPPFETMPWLGLHVIMILTTVLWVIGATIYETIKFPRGDRWYSHLDEIMDDLRGAEEQ